MSGLSKQSRQLTKPAHSQVQDKSHADHRNLARWLCQFDKDRGVRVRLAMKTEQNDIQNLSLIEC